MRRELHMPALHWGTATAGLHSVGSRLTDRADSADMTLLLGRAEDHAHRTHAEISAFVRALDAGDPPQLQAEAASALAHANEILHDADRLRTIAELGSRWQREASRTVRLVLHGLAGRLDSVAREASACSNPGESFDLRENLRDSSAFAASTAFLFRHILAWEREKWRLALQHRPAVPAHGNSAEAPGKRHSTIA